MANEAVCIETPTRFARFTVSNTEAVPIGTLMKLTDPCTCTATTADNDPFAGIAWEEHEASKGITQITLALNGTWDITTTNAAITAGSLVSIGGANLVLVIDAGIYLGQLVGKALETCTGTEVIAVRVGEVV